MMGDTKRMMRNRVNALIGTKFNSIKQGMMQALLAGKMRLVEAGVMSVKEKIKKALTSCCFWRKKSCAKKDYPFFSLTPDCNAERIDAYREAMDYALSQKDIHNIAVTGSYGAGKSSFLNTYFKTYDNVLRISLAAFLGGMENSSNNVKDEEDSGEKSKREQRAEDERRLELSILQQLFYKFSPETVPYSRLCKTASVSSQWYVWRVLWIGAAIMAGLGVWQSDLFIPFVNQSVREWIVCWDKVIFWVSGGLLLVLFGFLAYDVLRLIKMRRIRIQGVDVRGLGIQMAENTERSILNRNIDEIIYHFEVSKYQIVIFEDIDRFDDLDIFTKLREVNLLLNNAEQISDERKPIRFVYALKEELFQEKLEKVKFFDFVIPIVPVINASNSRGLLHDFLDEKCQINEENTPGLKKFIKDVSPYVSDMRFLKNICNEFYTYRKQIPDCTASVELLGMIVFKNFFPREFAAMHQDDGLIKALMEVKNKAIEKGVQQCKNEIKKCNEEIEAINLEKLNDVESLKKMYFYELMKKVVSSQYVEFRNVSILTSEILKQENWFEELRRGNIRCYTRYGSNCIEWTAIEKSYDPTYSYEEHVKRIEGKIDGRIDVLRNKIKGLRDDQIQIRRMSLVDLIAKDHISNKKIEDAVPAEYGKWQDRELLVALVRGGYINERYRYYISMFYDVKGAGSRNDYYFEVAVAKGEESDWKLNLENVNDVVENIDIHYFAKTSILNYALCAALLKLPDSDKAKAFFGMMAKGGRKVYEFIDGFLKDSYSAQDKSKFLHEILEIKFDYFAALIAFATEGEGMPREMVERQLGYYISWVLRRGKNTVIAPEVRTFVENTLDIADILTAQAIKSPEDQTAFIEKFGVKFNAIDFFSVKASGLLDVIVSHNAYAINGNMLKGVLSEMGESVEDFCRRSWTLICSSKVSALVAYVKREFSVYLREVYLKQTSVQEDDEDAILSLVNQDDVVDTDKKLFLSKQWRKSRISNVKKIMSPETLKLCIDSDWVLPSWSNAAEIWNRDKDDKSLFWEYVGREECYSCLATKNSREISWDKDQNWAKRFVEEKNLSDEAMSCLLLGMAKGIIPDYTGINATPKRIEYLVKGHRIGYSGSLYENLKGLNNDSHIVLAALCINEFCNAYTDGDITVPDAIKLLASEYLDSRYFVFVINTLKEIIIENEELRRVVAQEVNVGNFNKIDEQVLGAIVEYVKLESLQCKIIQHIGGTVIEIRERLKMMPEPYSKLGDKGCRPLVPQWNGLEEFLEFLKNKGVVSSFVSVEDRKMQVNTTRS